MGNRCSGPGPLNAGVPGVTPTAWVAHPTPSPRCAVSCAGPASEFTALPPGMLNSTLFTRFGSPLYAALLLAGEEEGPA